jgi:hypothetical protein
MAKHTRLFFHDPPPERMEEWETGMMWPLEAKTYSVIVGHYTDGKGVRWPLVWHSGPPWTVSGDPPTLTAAPSIRIWMRYQGVDHELWHGWIRDGELLPITEGEVDLSQK